MTIESITRKEACELIRKSIGKDLPEGEVFDKIVFAVNNDMQVRDFMLDCLSTTIYRKSLHFFVIWQLKQTLGKISPLL